MARILPPEHYLDSIKNLIYLAGPSKGAPRWEPEAIRYLLSEEVTIAAPRQALLPEFDAVILSGAYKKGLRAWEDYHFHQSLYEGVVLFWLPGEAIHDCNKSYAKISTFELGKAIGIYTQNDNVRFVVGTDDTFSEMNVIRGDLERIGKPLVYDSLAAICAAAVDLLQK